ncbi:MULTISPECIES: multicopper oxidase family protein [Calothrix]|uniref:Multicopper oxidase domain-containing protein n=2 Tax=Calothrix TaxID=1186 RepID=A0ABR8AKC9_9CYAN|nr:MULTISPECIES: multicopper oxidase [Calothrix]MBD2200339.1 multicopper oxidase domain-containing protein [Calothrix parietina FACHB-288]MBD2228963.1 multicopper oxidase domain-containing protein [Calothrix anomala FACHB-343]
MVSLLNPLTIDKYKNPLPNLLQPGLFIDARRKGKYTITMSQGTHDFGLGEGIPLAQTWGYHSPSAPTWDAAGLNYLGPTIVAQKGKPITINWQSKLPKKHLLPVDTTIHWAYTGTNYSISKDGVPVVAHLHGGKSKSKYDGLPDAWFTSTGQGGKLAINKGATQAYKYYNDQQAATIWYHDHALGITRLNVYAGLAGFYILRDNHDTGRPDNPKTSRIENALPGNYVNFDYQGDSRKDPDVYYEYPIVIQDKIFTADGQLFYPASNADLAAAGLEAMLPPSAPNPSVIPEFGSGNVILVNGKAWPLLDVEPRKYRFRLLNGSDSRFYSLQLEKGLDFYQIGTDLGLLNKPVKLSQLELAPGQRADVIVDFKGYQGETLILNNFAGGITSEPIPNNPDTTGQIMAFKVGNQVTVADTPLPTTLRGGKGQPDALPTYTGLVTDQKIIQKFNDGIDWLDQTFVASSKNPKKPDFTKIVKDPLTGLPIAKQLALFENPSDDFGRITPMLGTIRDGALMWHDPITEYVQLGDTEIWEIYNTTRDSHPIHLHEAGFQLLSRQDFTATQIDPLAPLTNIQYQGAATPAAPQEAGILDTVVIEPGEVIRVAATFELPGEYVWHCHILSHEDNEMMRPYEILAPGANPLAAMDHLHTSVLI